MSPPAVEGRLDIKVGRHHWIRRAVFGGIRERKGKACGQENLNRVSVGGSEFL